MLSAVGFSSLILQLTLDFTCDQLRSLFLKIATTNSLVVVVVVVVLLLFLFCFVSL